MAQLLVLLADQKYQAGRVEIENQYPMVRLLL
jgi:hypothetical protein